MLEAIDSTNGAVTSPSYLGYDELTMQIFMGLLYTMPSRQGANGSYLRCLLASSRH
jgi:hypothetical protein